MLNRVLLVLRLREFWKLTSYVIPYYELCKSISDQMFISKDEIFPSYTYEFEL